MFTQKEPDGSNWLGLQEQHPGSHHHGAGVRQACAHVQSSRGCPSQMEMRLREAIKDISLGHEKRLWSKSPFLRMF